MGIENKLNKPYIWLKDNKFSDHLPDVNHALTEPDGLLAIGGELNPDCLLDAYREGIFPWYSEGQPVMWWSPDPRCVLFPDELKMSRSLKKSLRKESYRVSFDQTFLDVVKSCAEPRLDSSGTWITSAIIKNYQLLHETGHAHSVECWYQGTLVGGLYGELVEKLVFTPPGQLGWIRRLVVVASTGDDRHRRSLGERPKKIHATPHIRVSAIDDTSDAVIGSRLHLSDHEVEVLHEIRAGWVDQALEIQLDPELVRERHVFVKQRRAVRQLVWRHVSENRSDDFSARTSGGFRHGSDGGGRRRRRRSGSALSAPRRVDSTSAPVLARQN